MKLKDLQSIFELQLKATQYKKIEKNEFRSDFFFL